MALIANVNRGKRARTLKPEEFNPYHEKGEKGERQPATKEELQMLRTGFESLKGVRHG